MLVWLCGGCALPAVAVVCVDFLVRETLEHPHGNEAYFKKGIFTINHKCECLQEV